MTKEQKIEAIKSILDNLSDNEVVDVNNRYQDEINGDRHIYSIDDFDELMSDQTPSDIANMIAYGRYNPFEMWLYFDGYGNVKTTNYPDSTDGWFAPEIAEYMVENDEDFNIDEAREILDEEEDEDEDEEK